LNWIVSVLLIASLLGGELFAVLSLQHGLKWQTQTSNTQNQLPKKMQKASNFTLKTGDKSSKTYNNKL
jgi:hypothetical protein